MLGALAMAESIGVSSSGGLSVSVHLETAPGALSPDRLAVNVLIPLDVLCDLMPPRPACMNATAPAPALDWQDPE